MSTVSISVLGLVLSTLTIGLALMLVLILIRIRRTLTEKRQSSLRNELLEAWTRRSPDHIDEAVGRIGSGSVRNFADLARAAEAASKCGQWDDELVHMTRNAAVTCGLEDRIKQSLSQASATQRGLAVLLVGLGITQVDERTLAVLLRDKEPTVRLAAAASLGRLCTAAAAVELVKALGQETLESPRIIERLGHPWAVPTILQMYSAEGIPTETRSDLLTALAISGDPRALSLGLQESREATGEVQIRSLRVLAACSQEASATHRKKIGKIALRAAKSENSAVRNVAASLLEYAHEPKRTKRLRKLAHDSNWFVRRSAIQALLAIGPSGVERVLELTTDDDHFTAHRAQEELIRFQLASETGR